MRIPAEAPKPEDAFGTPSAWGTLMQLRELMSHPVFTIRSHEAANDAWDRMREKRVRHLVVMQDSEVVGVISIHDLKHATAILPG